MCRRGMMRKVPIKRTCIVWLDCFSHGAAFLFLFSGVGTSGWEDRSRVQSVMSVVYQYMIPRALLSSRRSLLIVAERKNLDGPINKWWTRLRAMTSDVLRLKPSCPRWFPLSAFHDLQWKFAEIPPNVRSQGISSSVYSPECRMPDRVNFFTMYSNIILRIMRNVFDNSDCESFKKKWNIGMLYNLDIFEPAKLTAKWSWWFLPPANLNVKSIKTFRV
jgi:hypothetical protein